jgi:glycosyltransferase involved in cell wall biosynthesis
MYISVVIPAYNEEKYLSACLESLRNQTFRDFEVIVCDNSSTDRTREIAEKYASTVVTETKKGVGAARKTGFAQAKGEIIVSADADAIYPENWLQVIDDFFKKNPDTIAVHGNIKIIHQSILWEYLSGIIMNIFYTVNNWLGKPQFPGSNFAVRRGAYAKTEGFDDTIGSLEDADLAKKLMKTGKITFDPSIEIKASGRRLGEGRFWKNIMMYASWYYKTWWKQTLEKEPPMEDIR